MTRTLGINSSVTDPETVHVTLSLMPPLCSVPHKANNGYRCGATGRCVHDAIVSVYNWTVDKAPLEPDDDMDGGPEGEVGGEEDGVDSGVGFVGQTQRTDPLLYGQSMAQLRLIASVLKFPVVEPRLKEGTYGRDTIHVNQAYCTGCGQKFERRLPDAEATLLALVSGTCESSWSSCSLPSIHAGRLLPQRRAVSSTVKRRISLRFERDSFVLLAA